VIGGTEGDRIQTVTSKIKLHHYFLKVISTKKTPFRTNPQILSKRVYFDVFFIKLALFQCVLTCNGAKPLPKWGFEQLEIACNPTQRDPNAVWNVEDNHFSKLPNVSFNNFAPGFISRFVSITISNNCFEGLI
jgi:dolichyl-phosphate-mannose--protein O-mannosyl transferase